MVVAVFIFIYLLSPLCAAGEIMAAAETFLVQQMHPAVIIAAYHQALKDMLQTLKDIRCVPARVCFELLGYVTVSSFYNIWSD